MSLGAGYYPTVRREPEIICYWRANDASGSLQAVDFGAKFNLNGFYNNTPGRGPALIQGDLSAASYTFGGAGVNISVGDIAALRVIADISLEAWIVPYAQSQAATIIGKMNSGGTVPAPFAMGLLSGQLQLALGNGTTSTIVSGGVPAVGIPSHVVATSFRGAMTTILNGVVVATAALGSQAVTDAGQALYIGSINAAAGFNGLISEVAIYSGALSARRAARHFAIGQQTLDDPAHYTTLDPPVYS